MVINGNQIRHLTEFKVSKAGIISKKDDRQAKMYADNLQTWFGGRNIEVVADRIEPDLDILVVLGGDGTLLHVAETAARYAIPVLGINLGNLGFLTELTENECEAALEEILNGTVRMELRLMLKTRLLHGDHQKGFRYALNDVVINKNALDRLLHLSTKADNNYITTYRADGIIISTPTGSTAYNLSAGGPIVHPGLETILITPICPFMLSSRPIILPPDKIISSEFISGDSSSKARVIIDGQEAWEMEAGDILEVQTAEHPLQLISSTKRDYFAILRNKLKWASSS